jgi:hypothetical protein
VIAAAAMLGALLVAACRPAPPDPNPPAPPSAPPSSTARSGPSPRLADPRWIQARSEDPLEKARLAEAVGAAELLAGVEDGGETEATALAALPYAADAEVALARLAEIARADASRRARALAAILAIAGSPRRPREPLDLEGARRCGEAVLALALDPAIPRDERALAVSAARALAEKRLVDPARIPTDLDPQER